MKKVSVFFAVLLFSLAGMGTANAESPVFYSGDGFPLGEVYEILKSHDELTIPQGQFPTVSSGKQAAWTYNRPFAEIGVTFESARGNVNIVVRTDDIFDQICIIDNLNTDECLSKIVSAKKLSAGKYIVQFVTKDPQGNIITYQGRFTK